MSVLDAITSANGPFQALSGKSFRFACHPDVPCFNQCCADLTLALTPYDVVKLKNRLGLRSDRFIELFTEPHLDQDRFPRLKLKMTGGTRRPCPFVTTAGCSVYQDRPGACRIYPLGRGSAAGGREMFFLVREDHCRGFEQPRTWEIEEWLADQDLIEYNKYNDRWMEIITAGKSLGPEPHRLKKLQMFGMVSYNLDRFRDFVFGSGFLGRFIIDSETADLARADDLALLDLGFSWLKFALYGEKTLVPKES
ncbi:MAG: YkgJ family cysteine cluster protein [Thermodesulfobacteriota bacterium]